MLIEAVSIIIINLCRTNQKEDTQENARGKEERQLNLRLPRLQCVKTVAQLLFLTGFVLLADIIREQKLYNKLLDGLIVSLLTIEQFGNKTI